MATTISHVASDSPDAMALIAELEEHLASLYPAESRHGFSVEKLVQDEVALLKIAHHVTNR